MRAVEGLRGLGDGMEWQSIPSGQGKPQALCGPCPVFLHFWYMVSTRLFQLVWFWLAGEY